MTLSVAPPVYRPVMIQEMRNWNACGSNQCPPIYGKITALSGEIVVTVHGRVSRSGVPRTFVGGGDGGSRTSVEDRGQTERGSGGGSPLVRGSAQFKNE
jgi:hypothetical protein